MGPGSADFTLNPSHVLLTSVRNTVKMVETSPLNNILHLRNFPEINIGDKMQSFTLKNILKCS